MLPGRALLTLGLVTLLVVAGVAIVDAPVASLSGELLRASGRLSERIARLPDLLPATSLLVTGASWAAYLALRARGARDRRTSALRLCGLNVPAAYAAKSLLQWVFGRSHSRAWALHGEVPAFHWFHAGAQLGNFPSGHMTVFTALIASLWYDYPRHRVLYAAALSVLGVSLVATAYHFLSDVIAGAYLGAVVGAAIHRWAAEGDGRRT